jgi:putative tryptophan/tyrosine transport system substrate-binding protein
MNKKLLTAYSNSSSGKQEAKIDILKWLGLFTTVIAFVVLAGSIEAQQPKKIPRLGYLLTGSDKASESPRTEGIRLALRERGYIEGQNIAIEYRYAEGMRGRIPELAAELVHRGVDIIVVAGGTSPVRAAMNATKTIPIVMMGAGTDPVEAGLVESLARPGGNVTGLTTLSPELGGKRLELLKKNKLRSSSQSCSCRASLRSGRSGHCTRGERASPSRGACA